VNTKLGKSEKAANSDKLDGLNSSEFLRATANAVTATKLLNIPTTYNGTYPVLTHLPDGRIISHTDITYKGSLGILTAPKFSGNGSDLTGTASLRATGTTKADVGLSNIPNLDVTENDTANTIMKRNASGDTWARLFRSSFTSTNSTIAGIYTTKTIGGDYMRPSTPAQLKAALNTTKGDVGLSAVRNVGSYSQAESDNKYFYKSGGRINKDTSSGVNYANGHLELRTNNGSAASMGFHRGGHTACQLRHESNGLILSGTSQTRSANLIVTGNITAYSDRSLKTDFSPINNALNLVSQLTGYTYTRKETGEKETGLIAQEVLTVLPEAVFGGPTEKDPHGKYSLAYGNMVGLLIESIKEQQIQIDELKRRIG
jgi:hypothetical protein